MTWSMGGYRFGIDGSKVRIPVNSEPDDTVVADAVGAVIEHGGILEVGHSPEPTLGVDKLTLYSEWGTYFLLGGEFAEDGDYTVRTINGTPGAQGFENMFGEPYPAYAFSTDKELVAKVFREFAATRKFGPEFE